MCDQSGDHDGRKKKKNKRKRSRPRIGNGIRHQVVLDLVLHGYSSCVFIFSLKTSTIQNFMIRTPNEKHSMSSMCRWSLSIHVRNGSKVKFWSLLKVRQPSLDKLLNPYLPCILGYYISPASLSQQHQLKQWRLGFVFFIPSKD
jgi:hypothetical protein